MVKKAKFLVGAELRSFFRNKISKLASPVVLGAIGC